MLDNLNFDNRFIAELPLDSQESPGIRQVMGACASRVVPQKFNHPQPIYFAREVAELIGLNAEDCASILFTKVFSGHTQLKGMDPYAYCYGGHQFGNWAGQLGDGRAINLGEVIGPQGERLILQLKGAGPTPYSRGGDGFAVLRSSIREFLCSEAMFHLGIPTTRALSLVLTGEMVVRDMFYDGHPKKEPGAVVCRVSPSFTRFGSFEIFAARQEFTVLKSLLDYTIKYDFPHLNQNAPDIYTIWFKEVCSRTALMVAHWQRVGFVHGVMNTDNMSVLGQTIDYGPYGWIDNYDPLWTPNTTDAAGKRYSFGNQAKIAQWNLYQLANAIYPLIKVEAPLQAALEHFTLEYQTQWQSMLAQKLGWEQIGSPGDQAIVTDLYQLLELIETDMTLFFRTLARFDLHTPSPIERASEDLLKSLENVFYDPSQLTAVPQERWLTWLQQYIDRVRSEGTSHVARKKRMDAVNPQYVLRNYLAQEAIDAAEKGDYSIIKELLELLRHPYEEQPGKHKFAKKRPEWARQRAGCSMLSCSS